VLQDPDPFAIHSFVQDGPVPGSTRPVGELVTLAPAAPDGVALSTTSISEPTSLAVRT
jgi:hypothetical protein